MQWLEITINSSHAEVETLVDRLTDLGVEGIITEDEEDVTEFLEGNKKYWDYVDDNFLSSIKGVSRVKFYLEDSEDGLNTLKFLRQSMPEKELLSRTVKDEDWENNWKEYYKPLAVGSRLLIVPEWEQVPENDGKCVLRLDPGLIFGTGAHATTQMCLEALEDCAVPGTRVLDLGCGSGILAIAALLLGSDSAIGCDIDEKAPPVVMENAALNGIGSDRLNVFAGDVLSDSDVSRRLEGEKFEIVTANIVADVIIAIAKKAKSFLKENGTFICSGIIEGRELEVKSALQSAGFTIRQHKQKDGWNAFVCK
jgi:ribosomal protein L11 methyltransferase